MIRLRTRIYLLLTTLVLVTIMGGPCNGMVHISNGGASDQHYLQKYGYLLCRGRARDCPCESKGVCFVLFLDGDPDWLRQLGEYRQIFKERLKEGKALVETERQKEAIVRIEAEYGRYVLLKDQVILHYIEGDRETGVKLHKEMRNRFFTILDLCEAYKGLHREAIEQARDESLLQARNLRLVAGTAILTVLILGLLLAFVLTKQILIPIGRLASEADRHLKPVGAGNEVNILSQRVRGLIKDADHTQAALEKSRETLLQAEKMASVGNWRREWPTVFATPLHP